MEETSERIDREPSDLEASADQPKEVKKRPVFSFYGEIYKIETKRDGGGRVQIDFNGECLEAIHAIQRLQVRGDINFALAMVPFYGDEAMPKIEVSEADDE